MASTEVKNVTKGDQREASDLSFENSRKKDTRNAFLTGTFCKGRLIVHHRSNKVYSMCSDMPSNGKTNDFGSQISSDNILLARQTKINNIGARLVGIGQFGNKYVMRNWKTLNLEDIVWLSMWIRVVTMLLRCQPNGMLLMLKPKRYGVEHRQNFSGEGDEFIYHSKGHNLNPGQRDWTRYRPWQLTKS
ncbi:hypothetical protein RJ641_033584 [Dillenia turbinata]|uniref:Uncharacterized protein n=1 Tax=Dillenia turbinata TaxID=194707 RepID=A0AAN8ZDF5_9MAGN